MITKEITVERNYRIDNSDQYMKARLTHTVEPEDGEQMQTCTLRAISMLDTIFRLAYPHVEEYLNFHVERQYRNTPAPMEERIIQNQSLQPKMSDEEIAAIHSDKPFDLVGAINSCEDLQTLKSYKFLHKQSPEATAAYDKKLNELSI